MLTRRQTSENLLMIFRLGFSALTAKYRQRPLGQYLWERAGTPKKIVNRF